MVQGNAHVRSDRVLTIPNLLSILRLAGVPLFLWLLLGPREDVWAIVVLALAAISDWMDGKLARWLNQTSRLGALLDPAADRLYILATAFAFVVRDILPWWFVALVLLRDVSVTACLPLLRRAGYDAPDVIYLGKAGTFCLLYALPILLLAQVGPGTAMIAGPIGYGFAGWGLAMHVWSGALYVFQSLNAARHPVRG
ncbi:CDP-alcohol phosphatidyltransferase family protein [Kutzneria kofuensis]|uniref:Cardiolipin synthase n=1 Tax=Kutzneria kofuensis TaxID=103725 RepID=A0A7W9KAF5_9PSEU|nr:CDP-alcohol phosphatidyltransferase family protein [Kutzneria kofuensis]MBB5888989.1 cardiolipin synthase [Kutzneria kofuensis]